MKCLNMAVIGALTCALTWAAPATGQSQPTAAERRDGQHDFDFDIGVWKTHLKRLVHPLSGSSDWVELDGTTVRQDLGSELDRGGHPR